MLQSLGLLLVACGGGFFAPAQQTDPLFALTQGDDLARRGLILFRQKWKPETADGGFAGEKKAGVGLGPLFNAESCSACHPGGGAVGNELNVQLISYVPTKRASEKDWDTLFRFSSGAKYLKDPNARTFMLALNSTDSEYASWRNRYLGLEAELNLGSGTTAERKKKRIEIAKQKAFANRKPVHVVRRTHQHDVVLTERNSPVLFGVGLVDKVSDVALKEIETKQGEIKDGISGRLSGKFGWKGQTASLQEFVRGACSNELGLTNDEISDSEILHMTNFVAKIPAPLQRYANDPEKQVSERFGRTILKNVHCDRCHVQDVGEAKGIFSDLLLHDMGPKFSDPIPANPQRIVVGKRTIKTVGGGYFGPTSFSEDILQTVKTNLRQEWRTPPLWAVADSAPYMHDGRAETLLDAILMHDGEAANSRKMFLRLPNAEKHALLAFLKTLRSPDTASP